jgi:hypothetical protein
MADIELVIKIPEEMWKRVKEGYVPLGISKNLRNGTPLPKGHGRLGDLDKIWSKLKELEEYYQAEFLKKSNMIHESAMNGRLYGFTGAKYIVQDAPTIIEADKEE